MIVSIPRRMPAVNRAAPSMPMTSAFVSQLGSAFSFYGKFGRSFRIATVDENFNQFGGPAFDSIIKILEPQTAHTGELGLDYQQGPVRARTSTLPINLNNEISFINIDPFRFFANIEPTPYPAARLELEASWAVQQRNRYLCQLHLQDARFREGNFGGVDVSGNIIPLVPRHRASAGGTIPAWHRQPFWRRR